MRARGARIVGLLAAACVAGGPAAAPAAAGTPPRGSVAVLANIPTPGFPADPHVVGDLIYEGTYDNPQGDRVPSRVFQFSAAGALLTSFTVLGQDLSKPHGVQVAATDAAGRLILLDKTSGRVITLDPATGAQTLYARIPDIPTCTADGNQPPCSPSLVDLAPMPDYAVWGPDGSLYVTDYQQAVIWRIPPRGGAPVPWLSDRRLDGVIFGTAGIVLEPDHRTLLFDQASNAGLGDTNPTTGKLYSVQIGSDGRPGPLRALWESAPTAAPDGFAIARSGHIYLAEVGTPNQIVELSPTGQLLDSFGQAYTGANGSPVPFDSPSGVSFSGTELVIANQSYTTGNAADQALLTLQTGETGEPAFIPANAGLAAGAAGRAPTQELPSPRPKRRKRHRSVHRRRPARRHRHRPAQPR